VIEVADSSLRADGENKAELYAYANVPELWLAARTEAYQEATDS